MINCSCLGLSSNSSFKLRRTKTREVEYIECASLIEIYWSLVGEANFMTFTTFWFFLAHNILIFCRCWWICVCFEMCKKCYRMRALYIPSLYKKRCCKNGGKFEKCEIVCVDPRSEILPSDRNFGKLFVDQKISLRSASLERKKQVWRVWTDR